MNNYTEEVNRIVECFDEIHECIHKIGFWLRWMVIGCLVHLGTTLFQLIWFENHTTILIALFGLITFTFAVVQMGRLEKKKHDRNVEAFDLIKDAIN